MELLNSTAIASTSRFVTTGTQSDAIAYARVSAAPGIINAGDTTEGLPTTSGEGLKYIGLAFMFIPTITILGNLLVIMSVLRFKALQSAINFLILGLAVADLLVALFVMPYAVYVYVQRGEWYLGNLMCDIYMASDVACSTASILLLAVISFDRYRAVSRPIQYSRQSMNIQRVFGMIGAIWFISLALASPIVFGVNVRPPDANPYECRFYNAEFSIGSSIISFVIPCVLVLFVYIRIILALKQREKAAKMRRQKNIVQSTGSTGPNNSSGDDEAGRIVAGPEEQDLGGSSTPHSSMEESLSENVHVVTNDFVSEGYMSRRSSTDTTSQPYSSPIENDREVEMRPKRFGNLSRNYSSRHHQRVKNGTNEQRSHVFAARHDGEAIIPSIIRSISRKSPRIFRRTSPSYKHSQEDHPMILTNPNLHSPNKDQRVPASATPGECGGSDDPLQITETETISLSRNERLPLTFSRSTTANSAELLGTPEEHSEMIFSCPLAIDDTVTEEDEQSQPTVTFSLTVRNMSGSDQRLKGGGDSAAPTPRPSVAPEEIPLSLHILRNNTVSEMVQQVPVEHEPVARTDSAVSTINSKSRQNSLRSSCDSRTQSIKKGKNGLTKLTKRTVKNEQSLKRKVSKAQRKEKRATKTLGVVVGVFLICWVPFFFINIVNAVCIKLDKEFCQIGFDLFFYCTWLGYMNSFMNPIIYTIFNTEFRRAFKSLLFGRSSSRAFSMHKANV